MTTTFEDVATKYVYKAANRIAGRYHRYTDLDDIAQEMFVWLYGEGKRYIERLLSLEPQRLIRTYRALEDVGVRYAEKQKAEAIGYHPDDVAYYTVNQVEGLMPLVLDATYTRPKGQVDDMLAMVLDIRRVLSDAERLFFLSEDSNHVEWSDRIREVVNRLGGTPPYRRRAVSNAQAQAITRGQTDE